MKRTDIHCPSKIQTEDYVFVAIERDKAEFTPGTYYGNLVSYNRKMIAEHMAKTGGTYSEHEHGGNCHICGAHCIYTALFYHAKTNSYIRTGFDCADKLEMGDTNLFRTFKRSYEEWKNAQAGKKKAKLILADNGLEKAWELYESTFNLTNQERFDLKYEARTIIDIVGKLVKWGSISPKQMDFVRNLLTKEERRPQIEATRAAEKAAAKDVPTGRLTVQGTIIKTQYQDGYYGEQLKMLVKTDEGYMLWGSVPDSIQIFDFGDYQRGLEKGDRIELTASIAPSDKDPKFGFFKRPKATLTYVMLTKD